MQNERAPEERENEGEGRVEEEVPAASLPATHERERHGVTGHGREEGGEPEW